MTGGTHRTLFAVQEIGGTRFAVQEENKPICFLGLKVFEDTVRKGQLQGEIFPTTLTFYQQRVHVPHDGPVLFCEVLDQGDTS